MTLTISRSDNSISELVHLRILATTDLHANIIGYDYYADRPVDNFGLARTATLIRQARNETANHLTFDNGDFLQGTPLADHVAFGSGFDDPAEHPMMRAMNAVGYDAIALGNHEFNYGIDFLKRSISSSNCPILSANLVTQLGKTPIEDTPFVAPYTILTKSVVDRHNHTHSIRIGVLGLLPPQTTQWDQQHLEGKVATRDMIQTAKAYLPEMRANGADLIFVLAHTGIGKPEPVSDQENAGILLAGLGGIDALILGHTHNVLPGPDFANVDHVDAHLGQINAIPTVMAGFGGSHLGVIDLYLDKTQSGWSVHGSKSELRPIYLRNGKDAPETPVPESRDILSAAHAAHVETLNAVREPIGYTNIPLNSYFSVAESTPAIQLIHNAQKWCVLEQLKNTPYAKFPVLSAAAPFRAGGAEGPMNYTDIPSGPLAVRHITDLYKFPNTLCGVLISGRQLRHWLEQSAGIFRKIEPGEQSQELLNPSMPPYNFDTISGVTYEIDLGKSAKKISSLQWNGKPVLEDQKFVLAASNFRVSGAGNFGNFSRNDIVFRSARTSRDVLISYVKSRPTICPTPEDNWRLKAAPGTTAQFLSSPKARRYLEESGHSRITALGSGPRGFERFEINFDA